MIRKPCLYTLHGRTRPTTSLISHYGCLDAEAAILKVVPALIRVELTHQNFVVGSLVNAPNGCGQYFTAYLILIHSNMDRYGADRSFIYFHQASSLASSGIGFAQ